MQRAWLFIALLFLMAGCGPKYPNCNGDKDCKEKEFCVNGKCQQCRPNEKDCPRGQACDQGACKAIAGYCEDHSQCPPDQSCLGNRCKACVADSECGDGKCKKGRCLGKESCIKDDDCPQDSDCVQGHCVKAKRASTGDTPSCPLQSVYFDFNESVLTTSSSEILQKDAGCIKTGAKGVALFGHADPRGTEEYNLALSDRRAQSVRKYLENLGVSQRLMRPVPKGKTEAKGTDEASWAKDRRVDVQWE